MQFEPREQWIWLPADAYPDRQTVKPSALGHHPDAGCFTVVRIERSCAFGKAIERLHIRFSGDTAFILYANETLLGRGPACVGGDFLGNDSPRPQHYASELTLDTASLPGLAEGTLTFTALVRMMPVQICEYSQGHGGFFLDGQVEFADDTKTLIGTDERWTVQLLPAYTSPGHFDGSLPDEPPVPARRISNRWHTLTSPLPLCTLDTEWTETLEIFPGETLKKVLGFDRICAGYILADADADDLRVKISCFETNEGGTSEEMRFTCSESYTGFTLHSAGGLRIEAANEGKSTALLRVGLQRSHFPVEWEAKTVTSDAGLNQVLDVCAHTLKYCRQTHHLDSPRHCEPMACTGDYYIEMLMTAFTFGDQRLSAFDIRRTAQLLRYNDGRMFHTTYSLIWVQMLWDCWMLTGERELLTDCEGALILLLERFASYIGENGLIETPPDYMFIDWLNPDGISTHHPPKALGQTCLNLFYYGALETAAKVFDTLNEPAMAAEQREKAETLKNAILSNLWDGERQLFFEGLNTPTPEHMLYTYLPQNVEKRYYRMHANILAAYFGILPQADCAALLRRILSDDSLGQVQPYFMHFLLEAVLRCGLRDEWTLPLLEQWKAPIAECPKGLPEGFHKPEPTYHFDHSHAWGGTPAYALPMALSGLEIVKPGFRQVRLNPSLLGLDFARVEIPVPQGVIVLDMKRGMEPRVTLPDGVALAFY
ncbi:MAG: hypothetical protein IJ493_07475 [Clostridia bacterium]|nr:hypothetical protein [Clostridia bacterium]